MVVTAEMVREQAQKDGINDFTLSAIVGTLLGDACIQRPGKRARHVSSIRMTHSIKQRAYLEYKVGLLSGLVTHPISETQTSGYGTYYGVTTWTVGTATFLLLAQMVYPVEGCRKTVTKELLSLITHPVGLALWFGDDGSRTKDTNAGAISTNGFTEVEVRLLQEWLQTAWEIQSNVQPVTHSSTGKHAHILLVLVPGFIKLSELAFVWLPESMHYKLEMVMQTCPVCGKTFPKQGHSPSCSEECRARYWKNRYHEYYETHKEEQHEYRKAYAEQYRNTHREEIRAKSRKKYAEMTPEERRAQNQKVVDCMRKKPDYYREKAQERYQKRKEDPVQWEEYRKGRKAYRESVKADPVKYQRLLEQQRRSRQKPENKEKVRARQRTWRQKLKIEHPEKHREYQQKRNALRKQKRAAARLAKQQAVSSTTE